MNFFQKSTYRCEVWSSTTNATSIKLFYILLPLTLNYLGLSTKVKRFTLLRSPLGNKTSKDQFEKREYRSYFCIRSNKPSIILAFINLLSHYNEVKYKLKVSSKGKILPYNHI